MTTPIAPPSPVVTAIGQAVTAAMVDDLADVKVLDSIDPMQAYSARSVTIGGTWDPDLSEFRADQTILTVTEERGAGRRAVETTAVECIAYAGSGSRDFAVHRASVNAILLAVGQALRAITTIDGCSAMVRISEQRWAQGADDQGTLVMAMFTVTAVLLP